MLKKTLNSLLSEYEIDAIEKEVVLSFLKKNKVEYTRSSLLSKYFADYSFNEILSEKINSLKIGTIKDLENVLELLIPEIDRKLNGAFFTPNYVVDFIIKEVQPKEDSKCLDPSCGCGAFLVGLVDYFKTNFKKKVVDIVRENIFGADILPYNIHRTKLVLCVYGLLHNEIVDESDFNLYCHDSLRATWNMQFDIIVGNPPYVKFQDLSTLDREYMLQNWQTTQSGTYNLYFAFFELGYKLLTSNGCLGYITPNNYFTSLSGEDIRKYFNQKRCVNKIIDFNHQRVFDAQTYTAITFIGKKEKNIILFARTDDATSPEEFLNKNIDYSSNQLDELNYKKWRLLKNDEQNNIRQIETIGQPIGDIFDIAVGIATLKDDVYFINAENSEKDYYLKTTHNGCFKIEKEATREVYKISDFKHQDELINNHRRIIFPYFFNKKSPQLYSELEFKQRFPECYKYLLSERDTLLARDKGKTKMEPFFAWGRTQGLSKRGVRLLTPTFSKAPRFLLVENEESYFTNGYGIFFRPVKTSELFSEEIPIANQKNIDVVQKILNSFVMQYYISITSVAIEGGYPCYQKNFIEKFTIPDFSQIEIDSIRKLSKQELDDFLIARYHLKVFAGNLVL